MEKASDRSISIKLALRSSMINALCAYIPRSRMCQKGNDEILGSVKISKNKLLSGLIITAMWGEAGVYIAATMVGMGMALGMIKMRA